MLIIMISECKYFLMCSAAQTFNNQVTFLFAYVLLLGGRVRYQPHPEQTPGYAGSTHQIEHRLPVKSRGDDARGEDADDCAQTSAGVHNTRHYTALCWRGPTSQHYVHGGKCHRLQ